MNKGLPELLKKAFPNTVAVFRPEFNISSIYNPNWLVGFVDGFLLRRREGCFHVGVKKTPSKLGHQVILVFSLSQHSRCADQ